MSKKTNAKKLKRATARPRRRVHQRKRSPAKITRDNRPVADSLFGDPFFMYHLAGALFRAMELTGKLPPMGITEDPEIDAEFLNPKDIN